MGTIILERVVDREPGYLYYIDGQGNVCRSKMAQKKNKKNEAQKKSNGR